MSNNYTAGATASTVMLNSHSSIIADTPMINNYHGVANKPKVGGLISQLNNAAASMTSSSQVAPMTEPLSASAAVHLASANSPLLRPGGYQTGLHDANRTLNLAMLNQHQPQPVLHASRPASSANIHPNSKDNSIGEAHEVNDDSDEDDESSANIESHE